MRKITLLLVTFITLLSCSKSDNETSVKVDFIIENGNDDGIATIRIPGKDGSAEGLVIGNGKSINGSYNYPKDYLMMVRYFTKTKVQSNFKLKIIRKGSTREDYQLNNSLPEFTYVIEEKL